ncbi:GNAT family N-acetyltransferase [Amycolatopsis sp. cmx-11-12]|uniref:GNAT family N-acetyltransferase n=1 Tax=Amycolatopsis sp. cmx-11-12 TaxID=2785795 RepID=UPI00391822BD
MSVLRPPRGKPLGLLALVDDELLGWVAVSPRPDVHRKGRRQGLSGALLLAAIDYAARRGARICTTAP